MKNILIIGCGLLGSSLLRRIHKKKLAKKIFVYEKSISNIAKIKRLKLPGAIVKTLKEGVIKSDLIIFCTPMSEYKRLIIKINKFIKPTTLITDVGSSKIETTKIIKKFLKKDLNWIQSHPIAGSEVSGPEHGKENIFVDKWCVLIKEQNTRKNHLNILSKFWKKIGSKVVVMTTEKHDKIFSITSHLPHLIAYNLVKSAQDFEKEQNFELIKYSAGGLRDFSRIAASNEIMWRDIFFNNQKNISKAIDLFIKNLSAFKIDINTKNDKSILKKLVQTKKVRSKIIKLKQDIDKPDFGRN
ncbi:prephenate dehydrogenase/arogenate dehydrogenase family protein [Pelagibacterales bacterium SAG-MED25]|uniref:prephenate dehydrogenase n=1 Tax=Pelagibacter sp. (strain HTCC7211) TaxID=439493 RepID=UPI000317EB10|nr:prephenate dehydrogenase/arogenate dehydrogenase family protein [Candidatus Pelagibacter sp. HTCC7211]MBD1150829.1 prephenate dehydrogenase/arogenate dehydrogenase family protein [Pelagibacterales bacterium SAG-MED25]